MLIEIISLIGFSLTTIGLLIAIGQIISAKKVTKVQAETNILLAALIILSEDEDSREISTRIRKLKKKILNEIFIYQINMKGSEAFKLLKESLENFKKE